MQTTNSTKINSNSSTSQSKCAANAVSKKSTKQYSIRINSENQKKIEKLLAVANKKKLGRKIKIDQLLNQALELVAEEQIKTLQNQSLTNEDRKELLREKYSEKYGPTSKDAFIGVMLTKDFSIFLSENKIDAIAAI
jgi:hypothetical protein